MERDDGGQSAVKIIYQSEIVHDKDNAIKPKDCCMKQGQRLSRFTSVILVQLILQPAEPDLTGPPGVAPATVKSADFT